MNASHCIRVLVGLLVPYAAVIITLFFADWSRHWGLTGPKYGDVDIDERVYVVCWLSILAALAVGLAISLPQSYKWLREHVPPRTRVGAVIELALLACLHFVAVCTLWVLLLFVFDFVAI